MTNPYPAVYITSDGLIYRLTGEITFTDPANQPGGGGGGSVNSVTAGDASITIGGTATDPTVEVSSAGITSAKMGTNAVTTSAIAAAAVTTAKISSGATGSGQLLTADGAGGVSFAPNAAVGSVTAADTSIVVGGTGTAPTVRTGTLDVIATDHPPAADWSNNSHKITNLTNGSSAQDAAAFGQIPTSLPPNGSAGGDLTGTYPNPTVAAVRGVAVSSTPPSANQVLTASDATHAAWAAPTGGSLTVEDGSTTVTNVTTIDFTSGATVTNAGGGQANVAISGGGGGTKQVPLLFGAPDSSGNAFAGLVSTANVRLLVPAFTAAVDGFWWGIVDVPEDYSSAGTIVLWVGANDTTGHVSRWIVSTKAETTSATWDAALTAETAQNLTMSATAYRPQSVSFTLSTTPVAGNSMVFNVERNGSNGGDTLTVTAFLFKAVFQYST